MSMAVDFSLHCNPEEILSGRRDKKHWKDEKKRNE